MESQTGHHLRSRGVWFYQFQSLAIISLLLFTRNFTKAFPSVVGAMLLHGGRNKNRNKLVEREVFADSEGIKSAGEKVFAPDFCEFPYCLGEEKIKVYMQS